ncbi:Gfo/Idh/MocA family oxidoreductase [Brevibacterium sp. 50QC2O2]|uniref:Gfo/Idh/MocA family oxidoreductase n=1 Tax=Brevibacterium sp. 50QC2O2 TaxID=2968459 RepID=UPI00211B7A3C|nr:Gfo/Idh/MocA family oxidoreductase [Brevibacterium sp. 50QC2O2]MCQ9389825.1 Gfo/Idh/MocA family oxidoreductase [Brevibacterium sp. 50QC2O2]
MQANSTHPYRVGIVGFGTSGRVFHAPFVLEHPAFELAGVVTRDPAKRADLAELAPRAEAFDTIEDLLAAHAASDLVSSSTAPAATGRRSGLDLLIVGSPTGLHAEHVRQAIEAGVTTLVDKPIAPTAAAARELFDLADARGVGLSVYQNRRCDDDFRAIKALVDHAAFGRVYRFESRFEWFKPAPGKGWKARTTAAEGGGLLLDLGPHLIDQAIELFGSVERVESVHLDRRAEGAVAEDDVRLDLVHTSGVVSELRMNGLAAVPGQRFRVLGTTGGLASAGLDPQEPLLKSGMLPGDAQYTDPAAPARAQRTATVSGTAVAEAARLATGTAGPDSTDPAGSTVAGIDAAPVEIALPVSTYLDFYDRLAAWLGGTAPAPVTREQALAVMDVIEAARAAAN